MSEFNVLVTALTHHTLQFQAVCGIHFLSNQFL